MLVNLWPLLIISFLIGVAVASFSGRAKAAEKVPTKIELPSQEANTTAYFRKTN